MPKVLLRDDLQRLAELRLNEAELLSNIGHIDGAVYLACLGVECGLKACIARKTREFQFPDARWANRLNTHQLETLLKEAELDHDLGRAPAGVRENWTIVKNWRVDLRYEIGTSEAECRDFLAAISGRDGVMPWLKALW